MRCARASSATACAIQLRRHRAHGTIANIVGVSASIEPTFPEPVREVEPLGEFTVVNEYLVVDLKEGRLVDE